jgi:hypothetical protein
LTTLIALITASVSAYAVGCTWSRIREIADSGREELDPAHVRYSVIGDKERD